MNGWFAVGRRAGDVNPCRLSFTCGSVILGGVKCLRVLNWIFPAFLLLAGCATDDSVRLPRGFREVTINELLSKQLRNELPIRLKIPAIYLPHPSPQLAGTVWATEEDWTPLAKGKEDTKKNGYLIAQVSMNLVYNPSKDLFYGTDGDENSLVTDMIRQGWVDVHVNRKTINGTPVLFVEAGQRGSVRARMVYVAMKSGGKNALFIHYHGRQPWSELDTLTWETFKASLLASQSK